MTLYNTTSYLKIDPFGPSNLIGGLNVWPLIPVSHGLGAWSPNSTLMSQRAGGFKVT